MSKEEILAKKNWSSEYPNYMAETEILEAMGEYAKQQAVAFRDCSKTAAASVYGGNTTEQLYQIFIEHQKQQP